MKKPLRIIDIAAAALAALFIHSAGHAATRARSRAETVLNDPVTRLAAGAFHTCQVNEDGTVRCWGANGSGQLGDGTKTDQRTPVSVSSLNSVVAVAAGAKHTCALLAAGAVRCWGDNSFGQLGSVGSTGSSTPLAVVSGITNAVAIAAGDQHTCALLATGGVRCWGGNQFGQLGNHTLVNSSVPVPVVVLLFGVQFSLSNAVSLTAGSLHTCALLADGQARCWGLNNGGQLGDSSNTNRSTAVFVDTLTNAVTLAAGAAHTCALIGDGTARCWGRNGSGQLGMGVVVGPDQNKPVTVTPLASAVAIASGQAHSCALLASGAARCWGDNDFGQIGDGTEDTDRRSPVPVIKTQTNMVSIAAGVLHTCATHADGVARCWGGNSNGQIGDGTTFSSLTPANVSGGGGSFGARDIAAGGSHTCAVRANGTVACWGLNVSGQLGNGTNSNSVGPVTVFALSDVVQVAAGESHTCVLLVSGVARCWGDNSKGQLGNPQFGTGSRLPVPVTFIANAVAIAAGDNHTCALLVDGGIFCWGDNSRGQLGDGTLAKSDTPVRVIGTLATNLTPAGIAAGHLHTCAFFTNGSMSCWGNGVNGQLGNGGVASRSFADTAVTGLANATAVATGNLHSCSLLAGGFAACWGSNEQGQIGDPTVTFISFTPRTVSGLTTGIAIAAGDLHTCTLLADGTARCWGDNSAGQIGDGSTAQRSTPSAVQFPPLQGIGITLQRPLTGGVAIAAGRRHSCALHATGGVSCWGENSFGQVGASSFTNQLYAVSVPSFTLNIDPNVTLELNGRVSTVTIVANCDAGQQLQVDVSLIQGEVSGRGSGAGQCTGGLARYPVTVAAQGPDSFAPGPARVKAEALIRDSGLSVETQEWTRQVSLGTTP